MIEQLELYRSRLIYWLEFNRKLLLIPEKSYQRKRLNEAQLADQKRTANYRNFVVDEVVRVEQYLNNKK